MRRENIDQAWEFMQGEPSNLPGMPRETKQVNLPHDFMIETDVKADSVNVKLVYPKIDGTYQIIGDLGIAEIKLYKVIAVVPALVPEAVVIGGVSAEIQSAEPAAVTGTLPVLLNVLEADEITSHMIKHGI